MFLCLRPAWLSPVLIFNHSEENNKIGFFGRREEEEEEKSWSF